MIFRSVLGRSRCCELESGDAVAFSYCGRRAPSGFALRRCLRESEIPLERLSCVVFRPFWVAGRVPLQHLLASFVFQSIAHGVFELIVGHDGPRRAGANSTILDVYWEHRSP